MVRVMAFLKWVRTIRLGGVKPAGVVFAYALAVLLIVNIIIATFEAHA